MSTEDTVVNAEEVVVETPKVEEVVVEEVVVAAPKAAEVVKFEAGTFTVTHILDGARSVQNVAAFKSLEDAQAYAATTEGIVTIVDDTGKEI